MNVVHIDLHVSCNFLETKAIKMFVIWVDYNDVFKEVSRLNFINMGSVSHVVADIFVAGGMSRSSR